MPESAANVARPWACWPCWARRETFHPVVRLCAIPKGEHFSFLWSLMGRKGHCLWQNQSEKSPARPHHRGAPITNQQLYLNNKPLRFPKPDEMMIAPFIRPESGVDDDELLQFHLQQDKIPLSRLRELLPDEIHMGMSGAGWEQTKHADSLFIGVHTRLDQKRERYLIKVFNDETVQVVGVPARAVSV